jgi:hypothetical protein
VSSFASFALQSFGSLLSTAPLIFALFIPPVNFSSFYLVSAHCYFSICLFRVPLHFLYIPLAIPITCFSPLILSASDHFSSLHVLFICHLLALLYPSLDGRIEQGHIYASTYVLLLFYRLPPFSYLQHVRLEDSHISKYPSNSPFKFFPIKPALLFHFSVKISAYFPWPRSFIPGSQTAPHSFLYKSFLLGFKAGLPCPLSLSLSLVVVVVVVVVFLVACGSPSPL